MKSLLPFAPVAFGLLLPALASGQPTDEQAILTRSLLSLGNVARLQRVMARVRRGDRVIVGVIGGSITAGAAASAEDKRWANLVAAWWRDAFPQAQIEFVNAGIGATGSDIGAHRVQEHLLRRRPDFVVAEYAVNDANTELAAEALEGLTRQILKQPNDPAMMLLFTMHRGGGNAQEWHSKIGHHYGLPMVSFRDALWPEIEAGRLKWEDVEADDVHPNDRGHEYCAQFITAVLEGVLADLPVEEALPSPPPLPSPLVSDVFEYATMTTADSIIPVRNSGWSVGEAWPFGRCWQAAEPGSSLEFEVEGTAISVAYYRVKGDMGMARAQVDDRPPVDLQGWFEADWGGYAAWALVARDLGPGKHSLRLELLDKKAEASGGHKFQLQAVMGAGQRP